MMTENDTMQARSIKVVAVGYYGAPNVGDELLLGLLARQVRERGGELVALSINPEYTTHAHGIAAVDYFNLGAVGRALSDADLLVFGGGGIFQDHHPFNVEALYDPTQNDIAGYARIFYMARQFGVRTVIWAHGVGPLVNPAGRDITRDVFTHADHVSLRDTDSEALLHDIGVRRDIPVGAIRAGHSSAARPPKSTFPASSPRWGQRRSWRSSPDRGSSTGTGKENSSPR